MGEKWDLFFSYRTHRASEVKDLIEALQAEGLRIWRDETGIDSGSSITEAVRAGLANSRALLVYYTPDYYESRACQWELITAWAAAASGGSAFDRVFVWILKEYSPPAHLGALADSSYFLQEDADNPARLQPLVSQVASRVRRLSGTLGDLTDARTSVPWIPRIRLGSERFVGRTRELWQLHGLLHRSDRVQTSRSTRPDVVQIRGLAGVGKSLLAVEYGLRFEMMYPGGIFWIEGSNRTKEEMLLGFANHLGVRLVEGTPQEVELVRSALASRGPYLWVVDNPPDTLSQPALEDWLAPTQNGHTLITTRNRSWEALGVALDLEPLLLDDALALLTRATSVTSQDEDASARALCERVGNHPLALDLLAALVARSTTRFPYAYWVSRLDAPDKDALELASKLRLELPTGIDRSVSTVLLESLQNLSEEGRSYLSIASCLADAAIPGDLITEALSIVSGGDAQTASDEALIGYDQLDSRSLVTGNAAFLRIHALVRRVTRFQLGNASRWAELRAAVLQAVINRMRYAGDVARHSEVGPLVPHARELMEPLASPEELHLARHVVHYDKVSAAEMVQRLSQNMIDYGHALTPIEGHESVFEIDGHSQKVYYGWVGPMLGPARSVCEKAVEKTLAERGPSDDLTLAWRRELAAIAEDQGDLQTAYENYSAVWEASSPTGSTMDAKALGVVRRLGSVLTRGGAPDQAAQRLLLAFAPHLYERESDLPDWCETVEEYAIAIYEKGGGLWALPYFYAAYGWRDQPSGTPSLGTLRALHWLALAHASAGHHRLARGLLEKELAGRRSLLSPYHPTVRATLRSLEHVCRLASDDEASAQYEDEMLETLKIVSEAMPIVIARTLECSAAAHEEAGRALRARRLYQRLLEGSGGSMPRGTVDPYWLLGKLGIARASAVVGQTQEAERLRTEVENQLWEAFKDDARSDVEFFLTSAILASRENSTFGIEAFSEFLGSIAVRNPLVVGRVYYEGGLWAARSENFPAADRCFERAHRLAVAARGPADENPQPVARYYVEAGLQAAWSGGFPTAERCFQRAIRLWSDLRGPSADETMFTRLYLVQSLIDQGKPEAARELQQLASLRQIESDQVSAAQRQILEDLPRLEDAVRRLK